MQIEIWSDVVCPWCYIGKRHLETALARFDHRDAVHVVLRSFELDPTAPPTRDVGQEEHLATKYGVSRAQARAMIDRVVRVAAEAGLELRGDIARPGNTFDAHRLLHLARERGRQTELGEALFAGYHSQGLAVADHEALAAVAVAAGLDGDEVREVLAGDRYAAAVRADEQAARELGVRGVPYFVVDGRYAVSGAQPADVLLDVLQRAWSERRPVEVVAGGAVDTAGDGGATADPACGPDGCEVPAPGGG